MVVVAEGGPRNGEKLLTQPLVDGKFLVGRALRADIPIPAEESAVGQQHCYVRIQGNAVWLDTLPYQEVYVDAGRPGFQPRRVEEQTSVKLLPQDKLSERVVELGGLARNVDRSGAPFIGVGQTRLRIKLVGNRDAKVETEQARCARKRQAAVLSSSKWLQFVSTAASILVLVLVAGGLMPAWGLLNSINTKTDVIAEDTKAITVGLEEMNRKLDVQDSRLSQYYEGVIDAIREQHRRTIELVSALPEKFAVKAPTYYGDSQAAVWVAGVEEGGAFEGIGTAWVLENEPDAARRFLITNNHVLSMLRARMTDGAIPAIRRTDERGEMVQHVLDRQALLDQAAVHPDFEPLVRMQRGLRNRVNVFDVARLTIADPAKDESLGDGLKLAPADELRALSRQSEIGYIGFPHENLSASGVNVDLPSPIFVRGHISNLNDAFLRSIPDNRWQERQLLIVNAVAMGGASGSPVFNNEGRVIGLVSGGDVLHIDKSVLSDATRATANLSAEQDMFRVPIGFAYVIRSDVVSELVTGERPADRDEHWAGALNDMDKAADRAEFTAWKNRNCRDETPPSHLTNEDKLDVNGVYEDRLDAVTGKALYVSAQIAGAAGRLSSLDILLGDEQPSAKLGLPARLSTQTQTNIRKPGNVRLVLKGTPLASVVIDRYSCDLRPPAAGAGQ